MIHIIITSYKEPNATLRAVQAFLKQKTKEKFQIIVVDPFPDVEKFLKKEVKDKRFEFFLDPGEGKGYALNLLFQEYGSNDPTDLFILSDGDVFVSDNAIDEILEVFKNKKIGCVTGRPISIDSRRTKYGYWSHFLLAGIDRARRLLTSKGQFIECSGYLFAIRKGIIWDFPTQTSEDSIIPYLFWKKGYKIEYAYKAKVYVKNPANWDDWINQKIRNIKGHENLNKIAPDMLRTKSFLNEIKHGWTYIFAYPKTVREFLWTVQIFLARIYVYYRAFKELRGKKTYSDGWRENEIKSTKPLD